MATQLQEDLADAIVKNKMLPKYKRLNKKELAVSVGYAVETAEGKAGQLMEAKGVKEVLEEKLEKAGLTRGLIEAALVDDIESKPKRRERELRLGAEILGMTEHDKGDRNKTLVVIIAGESATRYGVSPTQKPS